MTDIIKVIQEQNITINELRRLLDECIEAQKQCLNELQAALDAFASDTQDNDNPRSSVPNSDNRA